LAKFVIELLIEANAELFEKKPDGFGIMLDEDNEGFERIISFRRDD